MRGSLAPMIASIPGARMTHNASFEGVSTDSRTAPAGSLFVALRGEHFDAHDFLPQVAASGDHQWRVTKSAANGTVVSRVAVLDGKERVEEIARMLGGVKITETTRRHAAEMLGIK